MQIKTIEKNLRGKMNEWLLTITDEELRGKVKNNLLVSGGSIVSLLLREDVNDYDVYIKDMDILIELVKYYTNNYQNITILDGRKKADYVSFLKLDQMGIYKITVENLKPDQVKLYFENKTGGHRTLEEVGNLRYVPLFFSPNAISLSNNVQIVTRFHGNNEDIHKTFDFMHATNYFTFRDGLVTNKEALESIICKQLKYQGSLYPLTSILRMKKFIKRGWGINAGEILKIMFQISELDLKNPNILEEQLIGVDVAYFAQLIEILRTVSPEKITSSYINEIIDRVFNTADEDIEANTVLLNDANEDAS